MSDRSEASVEQQPSLSSENITIAAEEESVYGSIQQTLETESEIKNSFPEKPLTNSEKPDNSRGKKEKSPVIPVIRKETKKIAAVEVASTKHISQNINTSANPPSEQNVADAHSFLSKSDATQLPQKKSHFNLFQHKIFSIIAILFTLFAGIIVVYILLKSKNMLRNNKGRNNCLLITKRKKLIKYSDLLNPSISLSKHLKNYGFNIIMSKNLNQISDHLLFNLPEIICIDWRFDSEIQSKFYKILKEQMFSAEFILIFYNVTDSSEIKMGYYEDRTFYLSTDFTISDLNKILSIIKKRSQMQKGPVDKTNPQFEGKIMEETLSEIFQMMDINKKTGCLIVETDHPAGMIFFEDGVITYAISNSQINEPAIFEILAMKSGRFHFLPGKKPLSRHMQVSVVAILMEQAKYVDEFEIAQAN
jgi:hypothetical protein